MWARASGSKLDHHYFSRVPGVKWDTNLLLPSVEYKFRAIARDHGSISSMTEDLRNRQLSLLSNWDAPIIWGPEDPVQSAPDGLGNTSHEPHPSGVLLKDSMSKEDLVEELKISHKLLGLVLLQCEHAAHVIRAGHTETQLNMRHSVLDLSVTRNSVISASLKISRLSTPILYGPLQESLHRDMELDSNKFPMFQIGEFKNVTEPAPRLGKSASSSGKRAHPFRGWGFQRRRGTRGSASLAFKQQQQRSGQSRSQRQSYPQHQQRGKPQPSNRGRGRRGPKRGKN